MGTPHPGCVSRANSDIHAAESSGFPGIVIVGSTNLPGSGMAEVVQILEVCVSNRTADRLPTQDDNRPLLQIGHTTFAWQTTAIFPSVDRHRLIGTMHPPLSSTGPQAKRLTWRRKIGAWLSLVERCVRDAEVAGSNPVAPTFCKSLLHKELHCFKCNSFLHSLALEIPFEIPFWSQKV